MGRNKNFPQRPIMSFSSVNLVSKKASVLSGNLNVRSIAPTHPTFQLYLEEREEAAAVDLKDLKFKIYERETSARFRALVCVPGRAHRMDLRS